VGGLWVRLGKIKCAAIWVGLCGCIAALLILLSVGIFVVCFHVRLLSVVTSFTLAHNAYVYDSLGFRSASLSTLLNEISKTKLQTNTEPQAGINILL